MADVTELEQQHDKFSAKDMVLLKRFAKYMKPYLWKLLFFLLLDMVGTICIAAEPMLWGEFLNALERSLLNNQANFSLIAIYCSLYLVIFLGFLLSYWFCSFGFQKIGQDVIYDIRVEVFNHIENLGIEQINAIPIGKYVTRVTNDTYTLSLFFTDVLVNFIRNLFSLIVVAFYVLVLQWQLGLIVMAFVPFIILLSYVVRTKARKRFRLVRNSITSINAFMSENLSGMRTIQIYNQEERKGKEFDKINDELRDRWFKVQRLWAFYYPAMYVIQMLCVICVFAAGIPMVLNGVILSGTLFTFYLYTTQFFGPIQQLATLSNQISNFLSSAEKVSSVLDMQATVEDFPNARPVDKFFGEIEFKHVWFAYVGEDWVLKDVSFKIKAGQTAAFVGQTGAGKSTIIGLIVRNYNIQKGEILIDGINIKDIQIESLRRGIGEMLQDVFLFSGTIADNISLNDKTVPHEDIVNACKYVGADKFIEKLPNKYDEVVRERGNNFSTGQRQLISFARVVVYKPQIIVLDEATANIDTETEVLIQDSLNMMRNIGTMLIVAHRLSTIKNADVIFVLSKGRIIEQGNHDELVELGGTYYNMYRLQNMQKDI